ncbi:MAG: hypothetical protein J5819_08935 [Eubacterium sp.]|nr:hypothetical protein [Eubacterium sp.]
MSYKDMLRAVPGSYDDFVNSTSRWMERDDDISRAVLEQMRINPDSDTQDIMRVLWDCLGIGKPVELAEDGEGEEFETNKSGISNKIGKIAAF